MRRLTATLALLATFCLAGEAREETPARASILKKGQRVAITGDSITEQRLYSKFIETYLRVCLPDLELRVIQLGWSGETAPGFAGRMDNDLLPWKPDVVTTCYGMNDGHYRVYDESIGSAYSHAMGDIVGRLKKAGVTVVVGGPGVVDSHWFKKDPPGAKLYNENLAHLSKLAKSVAESEGFPFADVFGAMQVAMEQAKPALGDEYDVAGKDGIHPGPNGHLIMAYAFLKAMGLDGRIGTITLDFQGKAVASEGHRIVGEEPGRVDLESSRYPFCFTGDAKSPSGTRSILQYVPFNADLNRLVLVVRNLDGPRGKVTWGTTAKSFSREELEKGVNLAAEFPDNPFGESFRKVEAMVGAKQSLETGLIKSVINQFPRVNEAMGKDKTVEASLEALRTQIFESEAKLDASVRNVVLPVRHSISVAAEK